jgi:hypothetical protein
MINANGRSEPQMKIRGNYEENMAGVQHEHWAIEQGDDYEMIQLSQENGRRQKCCL